MYFILSALLWVSVSVLVLRHGPGGTSTLYCVYMAETTINLDLFPFEYISSYFFISLLGFLSDQAFRMVGMPVVFGHLYLFLMHL